MGGSLVSTLGKLRASQPSIRVEAKQKSKKVCALCDHVVLA